MVTALHLFAEAATHAAEAAGHAEEEAGGISALGLDPLAILAQAATFLLLFWVVKHFALEKIVKTLEERRKTIDDGVRLGIKMEAEEVKLEEKIEAELHKARQGADKILADAQNEGGQIVKAAQDEAVQKVDQMLADARARIDEDMQKARKALEKDILGLVAEAAEVIIEEKLDEKKDNSLMQRALARLRA
jgi:F-type H+-transporting ATPase subunit b